MGNNMKKRITVYIVIVLLTLVGCDSRSKNREATNNDKVVIKVGVMLPLTGEGSYWGLNAKKGIQLGFNELQQDLKYTYELIFEDSETDAAKAVSSFNKMISTDGIKYSIVDMISSNVLAIAPIAEKHKIIIISPGASNPKITEAGDYVFRNWPSDALQAKEDARIITEKDWKNIAILKINNDYGVGLSSEFQNNLSDGFKIVVNESYEKGSVDFRTQLQKIKERNPDVIYLLAYPEELPIIFKQAFEIDLKKQFLGTETFESQNLLNKAKNACENALYTYPKSPDENSHIVKEFRENYKKRYKEDFGVPADVAYDALFMLINAIEKGNNKAEDVKTAMYNYKDYQGASGLITIDSNGDAVKHFELKIIKNNKFKIYE